MWGGGGGGGVHSICVHGRSILKYIQIFGIVADVTITGFAQA